MPAKTFALLLAISLCAACATEPAQRPATSVDTAPGAVTPGPEVVGIAEYLEFLDTLAVAISNEEPRALNARELEIYRRVDRDLRRELDGVDDIAELHRDRQLRVYNLHQELQGVIIGDSRNRVICRREHRVGTHFRTTTCMTVQQFEELQHRNRDWLRSVFRTGPMPEGG